MKNLNTTTTQKDTSWHLLVVLWGSLFALIISTNIRYSLLPPIYYKNLTTLLHADKPDIQEIEKMNLKQDLEPVLLDMVKDMDGDTSIYIEDLSTNDYLSINNHSMPSASLIKLFVAGCYYEEIEKGNIVETDLSREQVRIMISNSDNDAWLWLETYIGFGSIELGIRKVTDFAQSHGYKDSGRWILADENTSSEVDNNTSVEDIARVLKEIYEESFVNKDASKALLQYLKDQIHTYKIPEGIPNDVQTANKTGELTNVQNDAAIVYLDNKDYVIVVMMNEVFSETEAIENIIDISKTTYEYMKYFDK